MTAAESNRDRLELPLKTPHNLQAKHCIGHIINRRASIQGLAYDTPKANQFSLAR